LGEKIKGLLVITTKGMPIPEPYAYGAFLTLQKFCYIET